MIGYGLCLLVLIVGIRIVKIIGIHRMGVIVRRTDLLNNRFLKVFYYWNSKVGSIDSIEMSWI